MIHSEMPNTDNFQWTDELVKEFVRFNFNRSEHNYLPHSIKDFKASKVGVVKDYEILSFIKIGLILKQPYIFKKSEDGLFRCDAWSCETLLNHNKKYDIHSVKRLSDGEVFCVGGSFTTRETSTQSNIIDKFIIDDNMLFAMSVEGKAALPCLIKIDSPILITEDGVRITNPLQTVYTVNKELWNVSERLAKNATDTHRLVFSTMEIRDEYVTLHKPCLSVNDFYLLANDYRNSNTAISISALEKSVLKLAELKLTRA